MKVLKRFNDIQISKKRTITKSYWARNYFTRFFFYKNRGAVTFNLNYLGFGLNSFFTAKKWIKDILKLHLKQRFIFSFSFINPFFCISTAMKDFFVYTNAFNYFLNKNNLYANNPLALTDITKSFNVSVFFNNTLNCFISESDLKKYKILTTVFFIKKLQSVQNVQSSFLALNLLKSLCFFMCASIDLLKQ